MYLSVQPTLKPVLHFSKWAELFPLCKLDSQKIWDWLFQTFVFFDWPAKIIECILLAKCLQMRAQLLVSSTSTLHLTNVFYASS